jgi:hypothetical protein
MNENNKTIEEWLELLQEPERSLAIENRRKAESLFKSRKHALSIPGALGRGFRWSGTPQGYQYWDAVYSDYESGRRTAEKEMHVPEVESTDLYELL